MFGKLGTWFGSMFGGSTPAGANAELLKAARAARANVLALAEKLVNMPSGSHDYPAIAAKYAMLEEVLAGMGATVTFVDASAPREGTRNMLATWKGHGQGKVMYMGHLDTVWNLEQSAQKPFRIEGDKAFGAGAGDMQTSLAMLVYTLDIIVNTLHWQDKFDTLTVLMNCDEEVGSFGSRDLIRQQAALHDAVFSFDGGGPLGDRLTVSARSNNTARLSVTGVPAHSGSAPDEGRNAGYEMAHQMLQMRDLGDKAKGTDVNWTLGGFGTKANVIPGVAWAEANIRTSNLAELARVQAAMTERITNTLIPDTTVTVEFGDGHPPFVKNPGTEALAAHYVALAKNELGQSMHLFASGGGVDSGYAFEGAPTLEGMGIGGSGAHSDDEYAPLGNMAARIYLTLRMTEDVMTGAVDLSAFREVRGSEEGV